MKTFPIVGGVFEIALACIIVIWSSLGISVHLTSFPQPPLHMAFIVYGLVVFALGLTGGISAIKRTRYVLTLVGACSTACWGIWAYWFVVSSSGSQSSQSLFEGTIFGTLIIIFSILSLVFILTSKTEFTKKVNLIP